MAIKTTEELALQLPTMALYEISAFIRKDWKNVNFAAKPYLDAMADMRSVAENYGLDEGKSIVVYFLSNASPYRGENARLIKTELKKRVGIK